MLCPSCNEERFGTRRRTSVAVNRSENSANNDNIGPSASVIVQPVLGYVVYALQSSTPENIRKLMVKQFALSEISDAKS